jgi:hypothetical protein
VPGPVQPPQPLAAAVQPDQLGGVLVSCRLVDDQPALAHREGAGGEARVEAHVLRHDHRLPFQPQALKVEALREGRFVAHEVEPPAA